MVAKFGPGVGCSALRGVTADVCVVGGGLVGLALADALVSRGRSVIVIESGGTAPDERTDVLGAAEIRSGDAHAPTHHVLCRALGGGAWLWGGRCVAFDAIDFARGRSDPLRAWPISHADVAGFHAQAAAFLECGRAEFASPLDAPSGGTAEQNDVVMDRVERWCAEPILPRRPSRGIAAAGLTIVTGATVVDVTFRDQRVVSLLVADADERYEFSGARLYVLACGGLETARLLLTAQRRQPRALGGDNGPLGRYYMGHLSGHPARIRFADPSFGRLFRYRDEGAVAVRSRLALADAVVDRHGLPNVAFWPTNPVMSDPDHNSALLSMLFLILSVPMLANRFVPEAIRQMQMSTNPRRMAHIGNVARHFPGALRDLWGLAHQWLALKRRKPFFFVHAADGVYPLHYHAEQLPRRESRVTLGGDSDPLGMPRLVIDFRFSDDDVDGVLQSHIRLDEALQKARLGRLDLDGSSDGHAALRRAIGDNLRDGFSQIGLCRMGTSASDGVVNADCQVFDADNLFIAGSSVFRSSSQANPTFPAVALALRLATHLDGLLRRRPVATAEVSRS